MQIRTNKIISSALDVILASSTIRTSYMQMQLDILDIINHKLKNLHEHGIEKETRELLKFIDELVATEETRNYFQRKSIPSVWDSKYKADDIKELAEDIYRHRDEIDEAYYSDNMYKK